MAFDAVAYQKSYTARYYRKHRSRLLAGMKRYDKEHKAESAHRKRAWYRTHKKLVRLRQVQADYGVSPEQHERQYRHQRGRCAICREKEKKRAFAIDHNHRTGIFRGLLCMNCNAGLGHLRDSKTLLQRAIKYLKEQQRG